MSFKTSPAGLNRFRPGLFSSGLPLALMLLGCNTAKATTCDHLAFTPDTGAAGAVAAITRARIVAAGAFEPPAGLGGRTARFDTLPEFCRAEATLKPSADSEIKVEIWLPVTNWNGKLQSVGNGAWAGSINYSALASALKAGYATASTDTGHAGNNPDFITDHPERVVDFAWRSVHVMTLSAKEVVLAFYGRAPGRAYWNGCSTGGHQAFAEAQRFPTDYDGIIAGAPAYYETHLHAAQLWTAQVAHKTEASYIPPEKYPLIHRAAIAACDLPDGVKDGVIENPAVCYFDPVVLLCKKDDDEAACLTGPQVETARAIYAGPVNTSGEQIFPGLEPGSELGWATLAGPQPIAYAVEIFKYMMFRNPAWDYRTFDMDRDVKRADDELGFTMNSVSANLDVFLGRGGKLLQYHGWADPGIAPGTSLDYYQRVSDINGPPKAASSYRLFMVPGMGHCGGGEGTSTFDMVPELDRWIETGRAPERVIASRLVDGKVVRTRPLCPYPQVAHYRGSGSTDKAANFVCGVR